MPSAVPLLRASATTPPCASHQSITQGSYRTRTTWPRPFLFLPWFLLLTVILLLKGWVCCYCSLLWSRAARHSRRGCVLRSDNLYPPVTYPFFGAPCEFATTANDEDRHHTHHGYLGYHGRGASRGRRRPILCLLRCIECVKYLSQFVPPYRGCCETTRASSKHGSRIERVQGIGER